MAITALPTPPSRTDPLNFSDRADAFLAALPRFRDEANSIEQALTASTTIATSTSSITVSPGSKTLTTQAAKGFNINAWYCITSPTDSGKSLIGQITAYDSATGALTFNAISVTGSGSDTNWVIHPSLPLTTIAQTTSDVIVDLGAGNTVNVLTGKVFRKTFTANATITFSGTPDANKAYSFKMKITNAGGYAITWPLNVRWPGGFRPNFTLSGSDILEFTTDNSGADWYVTQFSTRV